MPEIDHQEVPATAGSIYPPLLLIIFSGIILAWSYRYGPVARFLPVLISSATLLLAVLDLFSRFRGRAADIIRFVCGASFQDREMKHHPDKRSEFKQFAWIVGCLAGMLIIGILPTIPLFVFTYMHFQGRQEIVPSLLTAIIAVAAIGGLFELLLGYDLYYGILFGGRGFG